jgi:hypothetical protein
MISPQLGRTAFRIAFMLIAVSTVMLFVLSPGTAEYLVSVLTLIIGLVFAGLVAVLVRVL